MAGNSRLRGGVEDGLEVEVAWPPAPVLNRRVGDKIVSYELQDGLTDDGRMDWVATETVAVVEAGSRRDTADPNDGVREDVPPKAPRPQSKRRGA